eukprot:evm.model.NODE_22781_length_18215_cov_34.517815.2
MKFSACGSRGKECKARLSNGSVSRVYVLSEGVEEAAAAAVEGLVLLLLPSVVVAAAHRVRVLMAGEEGTEERKTLAKRVLVVGRK